MTLEDIVDRENTAGLDRRKIEIFCQSFVESGVDGDI